MNFIIKGTKLEKRLARGDTGINPLDAACKEHDIAYANHSDRHTADGKLLVAATKRVFAKDSSIGERVTAMGVATAMQAKRNLTKLGKGLKKMRLCCKKSKKNDKQKKNISFPSLIQNARAAIKKSKPDNVESAVDIAVKSIQKFKKGKEIKTPRIIKVPTYSGGVLPLIPIFAGLGALGSIVGSATGIVNAINQTKNAQKELTENKRHNRQMESIAIGNKSGKGFYLHSNKSGDGYYLTQNSKNH